MRGRWQGSACLVPPCPGMLSQSQLLCPVPARMSGQPLAVPTTTLTGWLSPTRSPPSSASGLVKAVGGVHGAQLGLDITVSNCDPTVMGRKSALCLVPMHGKKPSTAAAHRCVAMHTKWCWTDWHTGHVGGIARAETSGAVQGPCVPGGD